MKVVNKLLSFFLQQKAKGKGSKRKSVAKQTYSKNVAKVLTKGVFLWYNKSIKRNEG